MTLLRNHAVVIGFGRVGSAIGEWLAIEGQPFFVIEAGSKTTDQLCSRGIEAVAGNAASPELLRTANLGAARWLFVAVANAFEAGQIVEQARALSAELKIVARAHFDGFALTDMAEGDRLVLKRSADTVRFVHPPGYRYFATLREKLRWSEVLDKGRE